MNHSSVLADESRSLKKHEGPKIHHDASSVSSKHSPLVKKTEGTGTYPAFGRWQCETVVGHNNESHLQWEMMLITTFSCLRPELSVRIA